MKEYRTIQVKKYIESIDDVREFLRDLKRENLAIHPEDSFYDCDFPDIHPSMISRLNDTLNRSYELCESEGVDMCELAWEEYGCDGMFKEIESILKEMQYDTSRTC